MTANQLITRALGIINQTDPGETPTAQEIEDGVDFLNAMMDSWRLERLMVYQVKQLSIAWGATIQTKTIGTGGTINETRPDRITAAFLHTNDTNLDYRMSVLQRREEWDSIINKAVNTTIPQYLWYDPAYPLGSISLWCVPSVDVAVKVDTWSPLQTFAAGDTVNLPPGYERAIVSNLAIEMAASYGREPSNSTILVARQSKAAIKTLNAPAMISPLDAGAQALSGLPKGRRYNIYADV